MFHYITILREDEYEMIQQKRREERQRKQVQAEARYCYSKEKMAELLKQRDLSRELKSLRQRRKICEGLYILGMILLVTFGELWNNQVSGKIKGGTLIAGSSAAIAGVGLWISYQKKIRLKKDEILFAQAGHIHPSLELYRQEGKSYV